MKTRIGLVILLALALTLPVATLMIAAQSGAGAMLACPGPRALRRLRRRRHAPAWPPTAPRARCTPPTTARSTRSCASRTARRWTSASSSASRGRIAGGYADAAAQDAFCANTYCWITTLYDQSGQGNHLTQAPRGGFSGPAMGGFNNVPVADMAPVTVMGHKVYGVFIEPGMGLRNDDPKGTAVDDQAEGQYWVINGHHYNGGCCFDYGNAETDSRDDGNGTMETTYYGNATSWYHGPPPGPWIMTDQENNLVGCVNPDGSKFCATCRSSPGDS